MISGVGRTPVQRMLTMAALVMGGVGLVPAASARQLNVTVTGALTISWTAEPSLGCAAAGLCGVTGSIEILPAGSSGSSGGPAPIELTDFRATARVIQRGTGG